MIFKIYLSDRFSRALQTKQPNAL